MTDEIKDWKIFKGNSQPHDDIMQLPDPPGWRSFGRSQDVESIGFVDVSQDEENDRQRGATFRLQQDKDGQELINIVNAAIYLRRPLLITGKPGTGKTSIAYAIAHELKLGNVLVWPITARSTLREGLYQYDAIARLQDAQALQIKKESASKIDDLDKQNYDAIARLQAQALQIKQESGSEIEDLTKQNSVATENISIGDYVTLGPLGTAFLPHKRPRVLLIDEVDKSDINLPNDLLHLFEEGTYKIPELARLAKSNLAESAQSSPSNAFVSLQTHENQTARVKEGRVRCHEFPIVILTSNGERDFPPAFLRRCLRITMPDPKEAALIAIVKAHLKDVSEDKIKQLVDEFLKRKNGVLAPDQLLNIIYLLTRQFSPNETDEKTLIEQLFKYLD
jgi:MoxR-like ATPase